MAGFKLGRVTSDIQRELSDLFRELKDPRISKLLSIVKVNVSKDLSYADIYVSAIEGYEKTLESVKGLKSAAGFLRKELSSRMKIRKSPELRFIADDSIAQSAHISQIISSIKEDK